MKEIRDIVNAYKQQTAAGKKCALATVVHVQGSSYRRPGARMLVSEDGQLTGAISGGCLEGDALRKALLAINQQKNKLVTYDTTDEDDLKFGVQLGCNGVVHILFEPLDTAEPNNPAHLLERALATREPAVLLTRFNLQNAAAVQQGTIMLHTRTETTRRDELFQTSIPACAAQVLAAGRATVLTEPAAGITSFYDFIKPAPQLVIAGAGNDAQPLAAMAALLGWDVWVVDGRAMHATQARFPQAQVHVLKPEAVPQLLPIDEQTAFVLMTHNFNYDAALLKNIITSESIPYIGLLGPRQKKERMLRDLSAAGLQLSHGLLKKLHCPAGLDLGAETSEEIALSILSEIKMVFENRTGAPLRNKVQAIHALPEGGRAQSQPFNVVRK